MYLCTRKCAYCAGSTAINTLKKNNLAFKQEATKVSFQVSLRARISVIALEEKRIYSHYFLNFKLKCQD